MRKYIAKLPVPTAAKISKFNKFNISILFILSILAQPALADEKELANVYSNQGREWMICSVGSDLVSDYFGNSCLKDEEYKKLPKGKTLSDIIDFVENLEYAGKRGWKIPSIDELIKLHLACFDDYSKSKITEASPEYEIYDRLYVKAKCPGNSVAGLRGLNESRILVRNLNFMGNDKATDKFMEEMTSGALLANRGQGWVEANYCMVFNNREPQMLDTRGCFNLESVSLVLVNDASNDDWSSPIKQYARLMNKHKNEFEQEKTAKENAREQKKVAMDSDLRAGRVKPENIQQAVIAHRSQRVFPLLSSPKATPDKGLYHVENGGIYQFGNSGEFLALVNWPETRYFKVMLPKEMQSSYSEKARIGAKFNLVGKYVSNFSYTLTTGEKKVAPVLNAVYFDISH